MRRTLWPGPVITVSIVVAGGEFRSMRAILRDHRRLGFRAPPADARPRASRLPASIASSTTGSARRAIRTAAPGRSPSPPRRTVTADVDFEANCTAPGASAGTVRAGRATVTLLRRRGNGFTFDLAQHRQGPDPWAGTVTGTIAPTAITLEIRATGTIDGDACDSGPVSITLDRGAR